MFSSFISLMFIPGGVCICSFMKNLQFYADLQFYEKFLSYI